ncbi:MAG: hypothetical protein ACLP7W_07485 [Solirubrobacteraceae bacterium]
MSKRIASLDARAPQMPVRLDFAGGAVHHLDLEDANRLYVELGGVLLEAEPIADTERPTARHTPQAIAAVRKPSGEHKLDLPLPHGISGRTAEILDGGKDPPKT